MHQLHSNGPRRDYVLKPLQRLIDRSTRVQMAAPYFTRADEIVAAARDGKSVDLLIGINEVTHPSALACVLAEPNVTIRYLTHHFHAKIFIGEDAAMVGSSNLTEGGLISNREATIMLDRPEDFEALDEVRSLFMELWDSARSLGPVELRNFKTVWEQTRPKGPSRDQLLANAVGPAEPPTVKVGSAVKSSKRIFLDNLQRQVREQYGPAFAEVSEVLELGGFRRDDLADIGLANETNRFLNWVRQEHAQGVSAWRDAVQQLPAVRRQRVESLGSSWRATTNSRVTEEYKEWLGEVRRVFGSASSLADASQSDLTKGLMSLHAFREQERHHGGKAHLPGAFWTQNRNDTGRVRASLDRLLFGPEDFVARLHDLRYDQRYKLALIGPFTALELYGTVHPEECPPINGRMAKALRFLGHDVLAA